MQTDSDSESPDLEPREKRTENSKKEVVRATFEVNLHFKLPHGISLKDCDENAWWLRYGKLHYSDPRRSRGDGRSS